LKSGRYTKLIAFATFAALCLLPGEAFGISWLNHATSVSTPEKWIAPPTLSDTLLLIEDTGVARISPEEPASASRNGIGPSWYGAVSGHSTHSAPVPQPGGLLIVAVAASWLVTCITRNRRRTVHYGRNWTTPSPARPSLREEAELGLLGSRRDVLLDTRVGAKH
jgi:hypothetical protein